MENELKEMLLWALVVNTDRSKSKNVGKTPWDDKRRFNFARKAILGEGKLTKMKPHGIVSDEFLMKMADVEIQCGNIHQASFDFQDMLDGRTYDKDNTRHYAYTKFLEFCVDSEWQEQVMHRYKKQNDPEYIEELKKAAIELITNYLNRVESFDVSSEE